MKQEEPDETAPSQNCKATAREQGAAMNRVQVTPTEIAVVATLLAPQGSSPSRYFEAAYRLIADSAEWLDAHQRRQIPSAEDAEFALGWSGLSFAEAAKQIGEGGVGVKQLHNLIHEAFSRKTANRIRSKRELDLSELNHLKRFHKGKRERRRKHVNGNLPPKNGNRKARRSAKRK